jgi:dynactin complex subunit
VQTTVPETPSTPVESSSQSVETPDNDRVSDHDESEQEDVESQSAEKLEGPLDSESTLPALSNGVAEPQHDAEPSGRDDDTTSRFDALVKDRDALRLEVTELRRSLEELQAKHASEIEAVQNELAETQGEKENAEEQYQSLLGKVNTIRSQLGERLKADAVG